MAICFHRRLIRLQPYLPREWGVSGTKTNGLRTRRVGGLIFALSTWSAPLKTVRTPHFFCSQTSSHKDQVRKLNHTGFRVVRWGPTQLPKPYDVECSRRECWYHLLLAQRISAIGHICGTRLSDEESNFITSASASSGTGMFLNYPQIL